MKRLIISAALSAVPLICQKKKPANLTFRDGGNTKHYDGIVFDSDTSGSFWVYTKTPKEPSDNGSRESILLPTSSRLKRTVRKSRNQAILGPFPATVVLKNNDVRKGWVYDWTIHVYENSLPAPVNKKLSEVTKIVFE